MLRETIFSYEWALRLLASKTLAKNLGYHDALFSRLTQTQVIQILFYKINKTSLCIFQ